jgi:hypothetical protein
MFDVRCLAIGLLLSSLAVPAGAAPTPFTAKLSILIGSLPSIEVTGSGTGTSAGAGGAASIPGGVFSIAGTVPINPPLLVIDGFAVGAVDQSGTGQLPLDPGTNQALAFGGVTGTMGLDLSGYLITGFASAPNLAAGIPLAVVGVGGTQKAVYAGGLIMFTVVANPYQLGMVTVMGGVQGGMTTLVATGFDNRGAGLAGLQLVSPTMVHAGAIGTLPAIAVLTFVPEPTTLVLLGAGLALLAGVRRGYTQK